MRIHCEGGENLLVPLHGYPVMNDTKFPRRVDFGKVAIGQLARKRVRMECKVPIEFEFDISLTKTNACFKVEPQRGVVPAHGHAVVEITFLPAALRTEECVMEVRIADFNSKPVVCTVTGVCVPGKARDQVLAAALGGADRLPPSLMQLLDPLAAAQLLTKSGAGGGTLALTTPASPGLSSSSAALPAATSSQQQQQEEEGVPAAAAATVTSLAATPTGGSPYKLPPVVTSKSSLVAANKGGGTFRGGAGCGDAYTAHLQEVGRKTASLRDCRVTGPIRLVPPASRPPAEEHVVDGIYVPATTLKSTADIAYVLNQEPGRLRIRDIKGAIEARKAEEAALEAQLAEVLSARGGGTAVSSDGGGVSGVHPLEDPSIPPHVKEALFKLQLQKLEEQARHVSLGSVTHIGDDQPSGQQVAEAAAAQAAALEAHKRSVEQAASRRYEVVAEPAGALRLMPAGGSGTSTSSPQEEARQPTWRVLEGNSWAKREALVRKFVAAAHRVIYRSRLEAVLRRLQQVTASLGRSKEAVQEEIANPVLLVPQLDRPGAPPARYLDPANVRIATLPQHRDVDFCARSPVPPSHYADYDELAPVTLATPVQYELLSYSPEPYATYDSYCAPMPDAPLMAGAQEELAEGAPCGVIPPVSRLPAMPAALAACPHTSLEIDARYSQARVAAPVAPVWGMDAEAPLQPGTYAFLDSAAHEATASCGVRSLAGCVLLCDVWLPRRGDVASVQLGDEHVPDLLSGPDPADLPADQPDDDDKPRLSVRVPTDDDLAPYLPSKEERALAEAAAATGHHPGAAGGGGADAKAASGKGQAGAGSKAGAAAVSKLPLKGGAAGGAAGGNDSTGAAAGAAAGGGEQQAAAAAAAVTVDPFGVPRTYRQREVDAAKQAKRLASIEERRKRVADYNAGLRMPCHYALKF